VELDEVQVPGQAREELQTAPILQVNPIVVLVAWVAPVDWVEQIAVQEPAVGPVDLEALPAQVSSGQGEPQQVHLALASNDRVASRVQGDWAQRQQAQVGSRIDPEEMLPADSRDVPAQVVWEVVRLLQVTIVQVRIARDPEQVLPHRN